MPVRQRTTETNIRYRRKRSGLLVPLLEDLLREPLRIENEEDVEFIETLLNKGIEREQRRNTRPVFSPSAMAACLRQVYLTRHHSELGISKLKSMRMEPNFYFLTGEWLHIKWQFACHRLSQKFPDKFELVSCEYPIISKRGDHGGTVDVCCIVGGELLIVDFKGLNVKDFSRIARGEASGYELQLADYMALFNSRPENRARNLRIDRALLVVENKGGSNANHPIALHETVVELSDWIKPLRQRLKILREHENAGEMPPPECVSTTSFQFTSCPFRKYCRPEVTKIAAAKKKDETDSPYRVARPPKKRPRRR